MSLDLYATHDQVGYVDTLQIKQELYPDQARLQFGMLDTATNIDREAVEAFMNASISGSASDIDEYKIKASRQNDAGQGLWREIKSLREKAAVDSLENAKKSAKTSPLGDVSVKAWTAALKSIKGGGPTKITPTVDFEVAQRLDEATRLQNETARIKAETAAIRAQNLSAAQQYTPRAGTPALDFLRSKTRVGEGFDLYATHDQVGYVDTILKVAGGLLQGGGSMLEEKQAGDAASADSASKLDLAKRADLAAVSAMVNADLAAQSKSKSAAADAEKARKALAIANTAGARLSPEGQQARIAAADQVLASVRKGLAANPKDLGKIAQVKAWTAYVQKLKAPAGVIKVEEQPTEPWLSRRVAGPIPGWGIVVGSVGLAAILALIVVKVVAAKKVQGT